jgi:hypothetical protein
MYPPDAYGGRYPFHADGLPGVVPPPPPAAAAAAAAGLGLGLRRAGSGSSRHRPAAAVDMQGGRVRHGVLQRCIRYRYAPSGCWVVMAAVWQHSQHGVRRGALCAVNE